MGHYRSEMGFDNEDERREQRRERELLHLAKCIQEDIDERGVARVLAEFLQNNSGRIHYLTYPLCGRSLED